MANEIKDYEKVEENLKKVKQIEYIQDGKRFLIVSELEKFKAIYDKNDHFVDKELFEEMVFSILATLKKLHRWKELQFIGEGATRRTIIVKN